MGVRFCLSRYWRKSRLRAMRAGRAQQSLADWQTGELSICWIVSFSSFFSLSLEKVTASVFDERPSRSRTTLTPMISFFSSSLRA